MRFCSAYNTSYFCLPVAAVLLLAVARCSNGTDPYVDPLPQTHTYKAIMVNPLGSMDVTLIQGVGEESGKGNATLIVEGDQSGGGGRYQLFTNEDFKWLRGESLSVEEGVLISNDVEKSVVVQMSVDENGLSPRIYLGITKKNKSISVTMSAYPSLSEAEVSMYGGNIESREATSGEVISSNDYSIILNGEGEFKAIRVQGISNPLYFGGTYEKEGLRLIIHEKLDSTSPSRNSETFQATDKEFNILKSSVRETMRNGQGETRTLTRETVLFKR